MAGIGIRLNRIYRRNSLTARIYGFVFSAVITVAPMFLVIGAILLGQTLLEFSYVNYLLRELFADTVLYTFIFAMLVVSPLNAIISKYVSDTIFEERFDDILPCFYLGLSTCVVLGAALGIPFCLHEWAVGGIGAWYVFAGYATYMALILVFYTMIYLYITKSYGRISLFFLLGMAWMLVLALVLRALGVEPTFALLVSLAAGFLLTASLEYGQVRSYFRRNSGNYRGFVDYVRGFWRMIPINFLYSLGLYIHIFVFWTSPLRNVLVHSFVTAHPYDMASCLAMFTNISATIIFITNIELHFRDRYRRYFEAVLGGRGQDIESAKVRMFRRLAIEITSLVRIQFIISGVIFLVCYVVLPYYGFAGKVMQIYPSLSVGYLILFVMYAEVLFLYYFDDMDGALATSAIFCAATLVGSLWSKSLGIIWYGLGLIVGATSAFGFAYFRLRRIEHTIDERTFCKSTDGSEIVPQETRERPSGMVYQRHTGGGPAGVGVPEQRKSVLFVINTLGHGGAETALIEFIRQFKPTRCDCYLYVIMGQGEMIGSIPDYVTLLNDRYDATDVLSDAGRRALYRNTLRLLSRRMTGLRNAGFIARNGLVALRANNLHVEKLLWQPIVDGLDALPQHFDVAIAYLEGAATYFVDRKVAADVKLAFMHTDYGRAGYTRALDRGCYERMDHIFCVSDDTKSAFLDAYPEYEEKCEVFHNLIDRDAVIEKSRQECAFDTDGFEGLRIVTLSRLAKPKALEYSIRAMQMLTERGVDARWYVFGEGSERGTLEREVEAWGLGDRFFMPGMVDNPFPYLRASDVYVQCSAWEGRSVAICEAQILGCAIVASNLSGNVGIIDEGVDGILVDLDPEKIADAIERLAKDPELRADFAARAAEKRHDTNRMAEMHQTLGLLEDELIV